MNIRDRLEASKDIRYRDFHAKLVPGIQDFIGVRVPDLRCIAKDIVKEDRNEYFKHLTLHYYEEKMICGFVIATIKDVDESLEKIQMFVPNIDNWAICDSFCAALKIAKKYPDAMMPLLMKYIESKQEFEVRFAIIMLLDHYLTDNHIDAVFDLYAKVNHKAYYVMMGLAWGLSVCYVKFPDKTDAFIANNNLDEITMKKYKQKVRESHRTPKKNME